MSETVMVLKVERNESAMSVDPKAEEEDAGAVRLLEDSSVVLKDESLLAKLENIWDDVVAEGEEGVDDSMEGPSSSRSASTGVKPSESPSPEDTPRTSATPPATTKPKTKSGKSEPQLIGDLPRAEEAALRTFIEIPENHYQYGTLGRSREGGESMTCDCQYDHGQFLAHILLMVSV
jgi:[histone H3]-lysine36 N-trimethyltransferase